MYSSYNSVYSISHNSCIACHGSQLINLSTSCSVYDTLKVHTVQQQAGVGQKLAAARGTASDRRATKVCCSDTRQTSSECLKFSKPFSSFNGDYDGAYLCRYVLLSSCLQIMTFRLRYCKVEGRANFLCFPFHSLFLGLRTSSVQSQPPALHPWIQN
jgi:hypothetical protein